MSKLAILIGKEEGFGIPGAVPTRNNNPGDLEHAPGEAHTTSSPIGSFPTVDEGWQRLEDQLLLYADRGYTMEHLAEVYAPPSENNTARYLNFLCTGLGCDPQTLVSEALQL